MRGEATTPGGSPDFSPGEIGALRLVTCEGNQVRQAEAVGQDDELHVVQVGAGGEHAGVQVLQHCPHAALASVRERHLPGVGTEQRGLALGEESPSSEKPQGPGLRGRSPCDRWPAIPVLPRPCSEAP